MIIWSRKRTLITGLALIVVVNLIALGGVTYNRSGEAESMLRLDDRELQMPWSWNGSKENSGVALHLQWRVLGDELADATNPYWSASGFPAWLDENKMTALGFEREGNPGEEGRMFSRQLAKEVYLVLELDGSAYRQALERASQHAEKEKALETANPGNKEFAQRAKAAQEQLRREQREASRLFVVDAVLDVDTLRAKYPDRSHYAIVRGRVQPRFDYLKSERRWGGYIASLAVTEINVPVSMQQGLKLRPRSDLSQPRDAAGRFEADVAFGKRLEPWLISIAGKSAS